jgi:hypothetical protein
MKLTWDQCTQNGIQTKTTMEVKKKTLREYIMLFLDGVMLVNIIPNWGQLTNHECCESHFGPPLTKKVICKWRRQEEELKESEKNG